jgi:hypothetical protein
MSRRIQCVELLLLGSEEPGEDAGLLEGAVLLERRKEMQFIFIAKPIPN